MVQQLVHRRQKQSVRAINVLKKLNILQFIILKYKMAEIQPFVLRQVK